jgi:hypothetical protein
VLLGLYERNIKSFETFGIFPNFVFREEGKKAVVPYSLLLPATTTVK